MLGLLLRGACGAPLLSDNALASVTASLRAPLDAAAAHAAAPRASPARAEPGAEAAAAAAGPECGPAGGERRRDAALAALGAVDAALAGGEGMRSGLAAGGALAPGAAALLAAVFRLARTAGSAKIGDEEEEEVEDGVDEGGPPAAVFRPARVAGGAKIGGREEEEGEEEADGGYEAGPPAAPREAPTPDRASTADEALGGAASPRRAGGAGGPADPALAAVAAAAARVWARGARGAALGAALAPTARAELRAALAAPLQEAVAARLAAPAPADPAEDLAWAAGVAEGALQVLAAAAGAAPDGADADELVAALLRSRPGWPHHTAAVTAPHVGNGRIADGVEPADAGDGVRAEGERGAAWRPMAALAAALGDALGPDALLLPGARAAAAGAPGRARAWLAAEALAAARAEPALRGAGARITEHLAAPPGAGDAPAGELLGGALRALLSAAAARGASPALDALCGLLGALMAGEGRGAALGFFREAVVGAGADAPDPAAPAGAAVLRVVEALSAPVRAGERAELDLEASGLSDFAEARLRDALALPPVFATLPDGAAPRAGGRGAAGLAALRAIALCFPVASGAAAAPGAAAPAERAGLAAQLALQLAGARAAGAAAAAARRLRPPGAPPAGGGDGGGDGGAAEAAAEAALAELAVSALAYAWAEVAPGDREALARRMRDGLAAAAVRLEDAAEAVAGAAAAAGGRLLAAAPARAGAAVDCAPAPPDGAGADPKDGGERAGADAAAPAPDLALDVLWRAGRARNAHAAAAYQAAVAAVAQAVARGLPGGAAGGALAGAPQAWARALALLLATGALAPPPAGQAASDAPAGARECGEALSEALRLLLAGGVVAAAACAVGPAAVAALNAGLAARAPLWEAVGAAAEAAARRGGDAALEAVRAADGWRAETGVPALAALAALALAAEAPRLADGALRLLLLPAVLAELVPRAPELEDDDADEGGYEPGAPGPPDAAAELAAAGVPPALAGAMLEPGCLGPFLAAWALLLAHLAAAPGGHRRRLAAKLHNLEGLVPALLDEVAPLLPLEDGAASAAARRRRSGTPPPAAAAAAAAAEARAAGEAAWSLSAELRAAGVPRGQAGAERLAAALFRGVLRALPASAAAWFGGLRDRGLAGRVEAYAAARESPAIVAAELGGLGAVSGGAGSGGGGGEFSVRGSLGAREAVAVLAVEEGAALEMAVRLPPAWPLRPPAVECRKRARAPARPQPFLPRQGRAAAARV